MVRTPRIDKNGIRRGAWSKEEDNILTRFVLRYGHSNWRQLPRFAGLARCGKSCRLRWKNYLKPDLKRGDFSREELDKILTLREEYRGNKWSLIASKLPGRTDNEIKNIWHTLLKKHQRQDPQSIVSTHKNSPKKSDQMMANNQSIEKVTKSTGQSVPMNGTESTAAVDSILEVSSDSMNSIQVDYGGILKDPFLVDITNYLITLQSTHSTGVVDSYPKMPFMDSCHESAFGGIWNEPLLFCTSNDQITQSNGSDSSQTICFDPFLLDTLCSQYISYNSALNDESVDGSLECTHVGSTNSQPYESDCCSWTQPLSTNEGCIAPLMPLETSDEELINLLSVYHSFMNNDDEDLDNIL